MHEVPDLSELEPFIMREGVHYPCTLTEMLAWYDDRHMAFNAALYADPLPHIQATLIANLRRELERLQKLTEGNVPGSTRP